MTDQNSESQTSEDPDKTLMQMRPRLAGLYLLDGAAHSAIGLLRIETAATTAAGLLSKTEIAEIRKGLAAAIQSWCEVYTSPAARPNSSLAESAQKLDGTLEKHGLGPQSGASTEQMQVSYTAEGSPAN